MIYYGYYTLLYVRPPHNPFPLIFPHETMFGSSLPPFVYRRAHVLFMLYLWCQIRLGYMRNMAGVVEEAGSSYPSLFILVSFLHFVVFFCLVYLMFPVSLDCPFLIVLSVFSNVYLFHILSGNGLDY